MVTTSWCAPCDALNTLQVSFVLYDHIGSRILHKFPCFFLLYTIYTLDSPIYFQKLRTCPSAKEDQHKCTYSCGIYILDMHLSFLFHYGTVTLQLLLLQKEYYCCTMLGRRTPTHQPEPYASDQCYHDRASGKKDTRRLIGLARPHFYYAVVPGHICCFSSTHINIIPGPVSVWNCTPRRGAWYKIRDPDTLLVTAVESRTVRRGVHL